jgi:hypothetical protein
VHRTYGEIREMIEGSLLQTKTARQIVRKSMVKPGSVPTDVFSGQFIDLQGQYTKVSDSAEHHQYGSVLPYTASASQQFPLGSGRLSRFGDFRGFVLTRIVVTVTKIAGAGCEMHIGITQDTGEPPPYPTLGFEGGAPTVPLDETGLHVSDWKRIEWLEDPDVARPAEANWWLTNPTGQSGEVGIGLAQLQTSGEL